jgi:glycosylphosphatidylinositol transamidase
VSCSLYYQSDFQLILRTGQNHWAFNFVLVVSEGYTEGSEGFMQEYHKLFPGLIWTAMNLDYPGHSFDHIGVFYGTSEPA